MDDLVIRAANDKEAIDILGKVLKMTEIYGLMINWKKYQFLKQKTKYLDHGTEEGMIKPSIKKIHALLKFPKLSWPCQVFSKMYYRLFCNNETLSNLLKPNRQFKF